MSEQEIVRYAYLDNVVRNSSHEELVEKLIELDEKHKKLKEEIHREKSLKELYRDRIDKAIEYIVQEIFYCLASGDNTYIYLDNLLEILKGVKNG